MDLLTQRAPETAPHPEAAEGEVLFINMTSAQFAIFDSSSKRMGQVAYDGEGRRLQHNDWFPVFVSNAEIQARGIGLRAERQKFRAERLQQAA
jgi:hypothetical protein